MISLHNRELPIEELMPLIRERLAAGQSVRFSPRGVSMLPMLRQGRDSVILSPLQGALKKYDLPLYQRADGSYILHRIVAVKDGYTCMGDHQFISEQNIAHAQMIAVVTAFYRGDRRISVAHPGYRLYCVLWFHSRHLRRFWRRGMGWLKRHIK